MKTNRISRLAVVIVSMLLITTMIPITGIDSVHAANASGTCGTCSWEVDGTTLTISGGEMGDWEYHPPWYDYLGQLTKVKINGKVHLKTGRAMFYRAESLTELDIRALDTSGVTDMSCMFQRCSSLTNMDVSGLDTSQVTDMAGMFGGCEGVTELDVSGFDTSNVTDMSGLFANCTNLTSLDVSGFDTSNVTDMSAMFYNCRSLTSLDVSKFRTSKVTDMNGLFGECSSLEALDVRGFDTSGVTDMSLLFEYCSSLKSLDVTGFDTSKVTRMVWMFGGCSALTELDVSKFDTSSIVNLSSMFRFCSSLKKLDLSSFDTSRVGRDPDPHVYGNIGNMVCMFEGCSSLTELDLSNFCIYCSRTNMFNGCTSLKKLVFGTVEKPKTEEAAATFPVAMYDAATLAGFDAGNIIPSKNNCSYLAMGEDPPNDRFKYYQTKEEYLNQKGFKSSLTLRNMIDGNMQESLSNPIPGIITTRCIEEDGSEFRSTQYIPQGLCKFGDYYIVSAYFRDVARCKPSVLYVLDQSWNLVTTVTIADYHYHNGGIAYDPEGDVLWMCGNTGKDAKGSYLYCLKGTKMRDAIDTGEKAVHIGAFSREPRKIYNTPSCLDFHNGRLWVGSFNEIVGLIAGYKVDGAIIDRKDYVCLSLDPNINGFTFDDAGNLYCTHSNGRAREKMSIITRYDLDNTLNLPGNVDIMGKGHPVEVPRMNEEILYENGMLYVLYESGANKYKNAYHKTDRFTALPTSCWNRLSAFSRSLKQKKKAQAEEGTISGDGSRVISFTEESGDADLILTPQNTGEYQIEVTDVPSDQEVYVDCEVIDQKDGFYLGSASTSTFDYYAGEEGEFVLADNASLRLNLTAGKQYKIALTVGSLKENNDCSGTYNVSVSSLGEVAASEVAAGTEYSENVAEGESVTFKYTAEEDGTYDVDMNAEGELNDLRILEGMQSAVDYNGNQCELEKGHTYYFSTSLNETDGGASATDVYFQITKLAEEDIVSTGASVDTDTALTYTASEVGRYIIKTDLKDETNTNINVYDPDGSMIAVGAQNILFNVEKPGSYRIVCEDVNEQMSLTVDPYRPDIKDLALVVPTTAQKYTGRPITPEVKLYESTYELKKGTDYTVEYSNNVKPGTARITIRGKGNYCGEVAASFVIAGQSNSNALKKFNAEKAAAKKVTLNGFTVKAQKSRIVAVSWTKKATVSGYEIQYSMKKNFKQARIATINRSGINRCAINNLKKKKKYFFRARTFTIVKNKATGRTEKVYGKWTTAKKIKVKK